MSPTKNNQQEYNTKTAFWVSGLVLGLCVVIAFSYFYFSRASESPETETGITLTGEEIAQKTFSFLVRDGYKSGSLGCNQEGVCNLQHELAIPEMSWKLLAFSGLYSAHKDSGYLDLMHVVAKQWNQTVKREMEWWNLIPFFRAYQLSGEDQFLINFLVGMQNSVEAMSVFYNDERLSKTGLGLLVPLMRSALFAKDHFKDKELLKRLFKTERAADTLSAYASRASELAQRIRKTESEKYSSFGTNVTYTPSNPTLLRTDGCWHLLGSAAWYNSTRDDAALTEVQEIFRELDFPKTSVSSIRFPSMQAVLPCVEAALEMSSTNEKYKNAAHSIVEKFVLPNFDSDVRPLCGGDNGFVAFPRGRQDLCKGNAKSIADNSWIGYLLLKNPDSRYHLAR